MSHHETANDDQEAVARSAQQPIFSTKNLLSSSSPDDGIILNDPFSSLTLLDPSHAISQSSKEAGRIAGRTASFNEGKIIGRTKGWEVGLELGYMFNFCVEILNGLKTTQQQQQRLGMQQQQQQQQQQHSDVQSFNNIDNDDNDDESTSDGRENMQQSTQKSSSSLNRTNSRLDRCTTLARDIVTLIQDFPPPEQLLYPQDDDDDSDVGADESHQQLDPAANANATATAGALDISTSIQRIRAKFKLLCVLLKTSQSFDLKRILELKKERNDDKNDNNGVVAHDGNVKSSVEFRQDDDSDVGVVRSRNKKSDIEHKSNGGSDW